MKFRHFLCLAAVLSIPLLSGCASLTAPARTHALEPGKPYAIDYDATRRGAYILPADGSMKICAEPSLLLTTLERSPIVMPIHPMVNATTWMGRHSVSQVSVTTLNLGCTTTSFVTYQVRSEDSCNRTQLAMWED